MNSSLWATMRNTARWLRFLTTLRSWQLFVGVAVLLLVDLLVPDPIPVIDEIILAALTGALSQWKKPSA
tara:strand:- start:373 stop:579 length:207 start_codon:yes stop_codon:yes gene_type:complete